MNMSNCGICRSRIPHSDQHDFFMSIVEFSCIRYSKNSCRHMEFKVMCLGIADCDFSCILLCFSNFLTIFLCD
jgi:hypothetical protein